MKISKHELAALDVLDSDAWITAKDVARKANIAPRTARQHLTAFTAAKIIERIEAFPEYLYRLVPRNKWPINSYTAFLIATAKAYNETPTIKAATHKQTARYAV